MQHSKIVSFAQRRLTRRAFDLPFNAAAFAMACAICNSAQAQNTSTNAPSEATKLPTVVVTGRDDSLIGVADSATRGTVGYEQLSLRPVLRAGEILETVPGIIITQHAGGGKANQYFLRGFNLDHGTDFATWLDGMPLNQPSHGHGQGYTDMNIVIPELVQRVNYQKGVYYAANGDFASAGSAQMETFKVLPENFTKVEAGMYGYGRLVFGASPKVGPGNLLVGFEAYHFDGPWERPDDYQKFNGLLTYSQGDDALGFSITGRAYHGKWNSSDQVADSAVTSGLVPFYGSLDNTTGGDSQRYSIEAEWHRASNESATKVNAYGIYYDMDLFSNFTYFLTDTTLGDQFEQVDKRYVGGLNASHTLFNHWWDREVENTFGLQLRNDSINNGLYNTAGRQRVSKIDSGTGNILPATTREDDIMQTSVGFYVESKVRWTEKFRTVAGLRGDIFNFDVTSNLPQNSGSVLDGTPSPKLSLIFGPWAKTEFYVQGGVGFHSNDSRGVNTRADPLTGLPVDANGDPINPAKPLVTTYGAEAGVRTTFIDGLHSTLSAWWLDIDSELLFVGDAGTTEASRPSRRYGIEWANYYSINDSWTVDADFSFSHSRFRNDDPAGNYIPGSIETVISSGVTYQLAKGLSASLRLRYFGPRPLIEDNTFRSQETILVGARIAYQFNKTWNVSAEVFNILNRKDHDIDYAYESRTTPAGASQTELHYHPVEPVQVRFALTAKF